MHPLFARFLNAIALLALLAAVPSRAAAATATTSAGDAIELSPDPTTINATCTLSPGARGTTGFFWTPPEELTSAAWRIPTSACAACGTAGLSITNVSFAMRWFKPCSAQARVSIVGATTVNGCLAPDTSRVLCGPTDFTISSTTAVLRVHSLALPNACCVSGDAFLLVRFSGLGACTAPGTSPGLGASTAPCVNCDQYVTATGIFPTMTEWCAVGATNSMWFSIVTDCCNATPALRRTWGLLKSTYR